MTEMDKLAAMLDAAGVSFSRIEEPLEPALGELIPFQWRINQIVVRDGLEPKLSAVCHFGSYGCKEGLIEAWCFSGEPEGWLTAEQAFAYFMDHGAKEVC